MTFLKVFAGVVLLCMAIAIGHAFTREQKQDTRDDLQLSVDKYYDTTVGLRGMMRFGRVDTIPHNHWLKSIDTNHKK